MSLFNCTYFNCQLGFIFRLSGQICERFIGDTTNEEDKDEEDIQLDKEVERYSENMFPKTYYDNDDLMSKSGCHVTYPEFMLLQKRLSSFDEFNWTSKGLPDPKVMAINGFFLSSMHKIKNLITY